MKGGRGRQFPDTSVSVTGKADVFLEALQQTSTEVRLAWAESLDHLQLPVVKEGTGGDDRQGWQASVPVASGAWL